jgi:type IV secretion system protein VirB1
MTYEAITSASRQKPDPRFGNLGSLYAIVIDGIIYLLFMVSGSACPHSPLPLDVAAELAVKYAPDVNTSTLLAFAWFESRLCPWAIHDNSTRRSEFPASRAEAVAHASTLLARNHSLDLGLLQVNSANLMRTGLNVMTAFDAGQSMRAGAQILVAAYQRCLHQNKRASTDQQQAALRCAASEYNTGDEQAGILNGYQSGVWRAAAQVVPAIQLSGTATLPSPRVAPKDVVASEPRRPPPGLEDALHATPPASESNDGLNDALHLTKGKDTP